MTYILAGDVGGTNCRLALASVNKTKIMIMLQKTLPSGDYASFAALLADFLNHIEEHGLAKPELAAFGVAGPVSQERARLTNLPWIIDAASLQQQFAFAKVRVLNDFEALAYAYPALGPEDITLVKDGVKNEDAPVGFLGAGTGLGAAVYFPRWHFVQPTESGHLDVAASMKNKKGYCVICAPSMAMSPTSVLSQAQVLPCSTSSWPKNKA